MRFFIDILEYAVWNEKLLWSIVGDFISNIKLFDDFFIGTFNSEKTCFL